MRTSLLINLLFLLGLSFIQAQEVNSSVIDSSKSFVVENHSIRANIVKPELQAGLTMGGLSRFHALPIGDKDRWNQYHKTIVLMPTWSLAVKKYYGFKVRSRDGLSIKRNSANFIALRYLGLMSGWTFDVRQGDYIAKEKTYFDKGIATGFAATWGINRDIGKEFSFNYEMGPISMKAPEGNWGLGLYIKVGFSKNL